MKSNGLKWANNIMYLHVTFKANTHMQLKHLLLSLKSHIYIYKKKLSSFFFYFKRRREICCCVSAAVEQFACKPTYKSGSPVYEYVSARHSYGVNSKIWGRTITYCTHTHRHMHTYIERESERYQSQKVCYRMNRRDIAPIMWLNESTKGMH